MIELSANRVLKISAAIASLAAASAMVLQAITQAPAAGIGFNLLWLVLAVWMWLRYSGVQRWQLLLAAGASLAGVASMLLWGGGVRIRMVGLGDVTTHGTEAFGHRP